MFEQRVLPITEDVELVKDAAELDALGLGATGGLSR
jgi:hypothetical protein